MKSLYFLSFFLVMTIEVKVRAEASAEYAEHLAGENSYIEKDLLLSGEHWFRKTQDLTLETPYGSIQSFQGDFYVKKQDNRVLVVNNAGGLSVKLRDSSVVKVPPGFEFWFSELQEDKKNQVGQIQPLDLKDHVRALASLWTHKASDLKTEIRKFQSRWGDPVKEASVYYKGLAERKISSLQKEEWRMLSKQQQEVRRRDANRKLLFERAFGR